MNGARALLSTLVAGGVEVCFANPGTSEMHFVAALDDVPELRGVLCLFEGVATGAADGYARMTGRPAATLLHLGPGLGNGIANLHNARRAGTPLVNVIGDHATYHQRFDALLESDIDALAGAVSGWVRRSSSPESVGADAAAAIAAALGGPGPGEPVLAGGRVATLVVPADVSWTEGGETAAPHLARPPATVPDALIMDLAGRLGPRATLFLGGAALGERGLRAADRIARATGTRLLAETFPARIRRGAGVPTVDRLAYRGEVAARQLAGTTLLILAGAPAPVSFFAYPGQPSTFAPADAVVRDLADARAEAHRDPAGVDVVDALERLAEAVAAEVEPVGAEAGRPELPSGALTSATWAAVVGRLLPDDSIVVDESLTSGMASVPAATAGAPAHDLLTLTGGAIGDGLPVAVGAAVACPDRQVISLQADGSAMYTIQALWTQARENLDVTTVILNNRAYAILQAELDRVGASGGKQAAQLLDLSGPDLDFVALAAGCGVSATRATTIAELADQFTRALAEPGPHLIDAILE